MAKKFPPDRSYSSLSVKDLIEARDAYHVHLSHLPNVIATAIGRYRIHQDDWYAAHSPEEKKPDDFKPIKDKKTLYNTVIRAWSWPCVLVFVEKWLDRSKFRENPDEMVPRALFLPDGRVIPTCVIEAARQDEPAATADAPSFPNGLIGGGFLLSTSVQGADHFGSVGCLVSNGRSVFALTNQHVAGAPGERVYSILRGNRVPVGTTAATAVKKLAFDVAYPGFSIARSLSNLDVALVEVDDVTMWTTQIAGLGSVGTPVDIESSNLSLDMIDRDVVAFGGASGLLRGKITGLFYRYKSIGGTDYISDLLIRPAEGQTTRPGDSGTLWCLYDPQETPSERYRPMALQWGGHVLVESGQPGVAQGLSLATFVSTICRELDIDMMRGVNAGLPEYWGDVGHYTVGAKACQLIVNKQLSSLMVANLDRVAYGDENLKTHTLKKVGDEGFWPLADVPDKVWKNGPFRRGLESSNHFADMDKPDSNGQTLLDLTADANGDTDPRKVSVQVFSDYYDDIHDRSKGILPFRVWQLFDVMVAAARSGDPVGFVGAAGVMAHYVGDACQPLHISYKYNGDPDFVGDDGEIYGHEVHSAYEDKMLKANSAELLARLNTELGISPGHLGTHGFKRYVETGHGAAVAVVNLMRQAFETISPDKIIETYVNERPKLWERHGDKTVELIAEGSRTLAMIWESAWRVDGNTITKLTAVDRKALMRKYEDENWAPSTNIKGIEAILTAAPGAGGPGPRRRRQPSPTPSPRPRANM